MTPYQEYEEQLKQKEREEKKRYTEEKEKEKQKEKKFKTDSIKENATVYEAMRQRKITLRQMLEEQRKILNARTKLRQAQDQERINQQHKFENVSIIDLLHHAK